MTEIATCSWSFVRQGVIQNTNGDAHIEVFGPRSTLHRRSGRHDPGGKMKDVRREPISVKKVERGGDHGTGLFRRRAARRPPRTAGTHRRTRPSSRIINEPTAADAGLRDRQAGGDLHRVAVYDLGGGTFDISILELREAASFERARPPPVTRIPRRRGLRQQDRSTRGARGPASKEEHGIDLRDEKLARQRLKEAGGEGQARAEHWSLDTDVNLPFIAANASGTPLHLET